MAEAASSAAAAPIEATSSSSSSSAPVNHGHGPAAALNDTATASASARSLLSRRTHIQPGDTILLELPTKLVKVVKLSLDSRNILQLGKYGTFDADAELVGKPYGVTYEIVPAAASTSRNGDGSGATAEGAAGADDAAEADGADAAEDAVEGKMSGASKRKQKREAAEEKTRNAKGKGKGVAVTNSTSKQLDSLRPLEGLSLEDIEVTEATNEKILAQGAKVRRSGPG